MPRRHEEIVAEMDYEKNVFGRDEDRAIIGICADGTTVKGKAREGALETGLTYRFYGYWIEHPKYGRQFAFSSFTLASPSGMRGTVAYLQRGPGIGKKRALKIWEKYGPDSLTVCREQPHLVAECCGGLTMEQAQNAAEYFERLAGLEAVTIELTDLLGGRGFPRNIIEILIGRHGNRAPAVVRENVYILMEERGVGFLKADQLYLELGGNPAAINRQAYCAWHALHSDSEGHTWYQLEKCGAALEKNVGGSEVDLQQAIKWADDENLIVTRVADGVVWVAEATKAWAEQRLANAIHMAEVEAAQKPSRWPEPAALANVSDHQREHYAAATAGLVGILAGRPGTGKTFTIAEAIKALRCRRLAVCAPTGKAAVRVTESLAKAGVQGVKATTIHSLLRVLSAENGWQFEHDEYNPLPLDFILVDEASMIDTPLAASLLAARPAGCHVLFVGDPGQLSPVGHGAPLRDLIAAGLPCGELREIQRNSGRIVKACHAIADHGRYEPAAKLDLENGENLVHVECSRPEQQIEQLKALIGRIKTGGTYDAVWDLQIVVPVNDKSPLGRKPLNAMLQGLLNPNGDQAKGNPFRRDDKVICTQNGSLPAEGKGQKEADANGKLYVANGEQAAVIESAPNYTSAALDNPPRRVRIPKGQSYQNENGETEDFGCNWELAYAISVHKSQGSEWPIVVVLIDSYPGAVRLCTKEWLYTALSRGKAMVVTIGQQRLANDMCRRSGLWTRKTFLRETIESLRGAVIGRAFDEVLAEV